MTGLQTLNGSARRLATVPAFADPFSLVSRDFDRMFGSIFGTPTAEGGDIARAMLSPRIDVHETDDLIEMSAELPGVEQDDIDVSVLDGVLTISGEKKATRESDDGARIVERSYGSFKRSFRLPETVKTDEIKASFKNGVLTLTLPKVVEEKPEPRKIAING